MRKLLLLLLLASNCLTAQNSAHFNGSNYLQLSDQTFNFTNQVFTITGWYKLDTLGDKRIILSKWSGVDNERGYMLAYAHSATEMRWIVSSDGTASGNVIVASTAPQYVDSTYFFSLIHTGDSIGISINAEPFVMAAFSGPIHSTPYPMKVGSEINSNGGDEYMIGTIDNLAVFNVILTKAESDLIFNEKSGISVSNYPHIENIIEYWDMDETGCNRGGMNGFVLTDINGVGYDVGIISK